MLGFNPRSHEGSDYFINELKKRLSGFNPRSHEGSDVFFILPFMVLVVSIHAPTRGATFRFLKIVVRQKCFNPRSHEGSDRHVMEQCRKHNGFNPRSHEGSDLAGHGETTSWGVSIHAPTRGATKYYDVFMTFDIVSIHAPTRGATE